MVRHFQEILSPDSRRTVRNFELECRVDDPSATPPRPSDWKKNPFGCLVDDVRPTPEVAYTINFFYRAEGGETIWSNERSFQRSMTWLIIEAKYERCYFVVFRDQEALSLTRMIWKRKSKVWRIENIMFN